MMDSNPIILNFNFYHYLYGKKNLLMFSDSPCTKSHKNCMLLFYVVDYLFSSLLYGFNLSAVICMRCMLLFHLVDYLFSSFLQRFKLNALFF